VKSYTYKININESVKEQLSQLPKPWSETAPKQLTVQVDLHEVILFDDQGFATRLDLITEKLEFIIQNQRVEGELSLEEVLKSNKSGPNDIASLRMRSQKTFSLGRQDFPVKMLRLTSKKDGSTFDIIDTPDIRIPVPAMRLIYSLLIPGVQYKASYGFPVSIEVADADQQKLVTATLVKKESGKLPVFEDFLSIPVTKKSLELEQIEWNSNKNKARELPDTELRKKIPSEKAVRKGVLPSSLRAKSSSTEKPWFYSFLLNFVQIYHGAEVGLGIRNGAFETLRNAINPLLNIGNFSAFRIGNSEQLIFAKNFYFDIAQQFTAEYRDLIPQWIVLAYLMTGGEPLLQSEATPDGLDLEARLKLERLPRLLEEFQFIGFDPNYYRAQWEMPALAPDWVREIRDNVPNDSTMSQVHRDLLQWAQYDDDVGAMQTLLQNIHNAVKSEKPDISPYEIKQLAYVVILDILRNDLITKLEFTSITREVNRVLLFRNNEADSKNFIDAQLSALLTFSDTLTMKSSRIGAFGMEIEIHTPSLLSADTYNSMIRSISHTGDGGIRLHINIPTLRYHSHLQLHFDLLTVIGTIASWVEFGWVGMIIGAGTLLSLKIPRPIHLLAQNIDVHLLLRREAVHETNFETGWGFRPSLTTPGFGVIINNLGMDNTRGIDIPGHIIDAVLTSGSVFAGKLTEGLEKELYKLLTKQPDWLIELGQIDYFAPVKRLLPWPSLIHFDGLYLKLSVPECSSDTCFEVLWAQVRHGEMNEAGIQDVDLTDVNQLCIIMNRATLGRWFYGFTQLLRVDDVSPPLKYSAAEAWANDVGLGNVDIDLLPEPQEAVRDRGDLPLLPEIEELFGTDSPSRPPAGGRTIRFLRLTVGRDLLQAEENHNIPNDRAMELVIDYSIRLDAVLEQSVWVARRVETQTPRWQLPVNEQESDTAPGYEHGGPSEPVNHHDEHDPSSANWEGPNSPDPNDLVTTIEVEWRRTRRQYILETLVKANVSVHQGLVFGFEKTEASDSPNASGLSIEFPSLVLALKRDGDNVLTDANIEELNTYSDTINEDFLRQYCIADTQKMLYEMPVLNNKNLYNNKATGAWGLTDIIPAEMLDDLPEGLRNARLVQSINGPAPGEAWSDNQTFHYLHRDDSIIWPVNIELDSSELFVS